MTNSTTLACLHVIKALSKSGQENNINNYFLTSVHFGSHLKGESNYFVFSFGGVIC
jgi:hypothetical protein